MKRLAYFWFRLNRVAFFGSRVQGLLVIYLFLDNLGISIWWMLTLIPLGYIIHWWDKNYNLPVEQDVLIDQMKDRMK